jgi:hypothetical protein
MDNLEKLTAENGINENIQNVNSFEDLPESMKEEFADGKGGED